MTNDEDAPGGLGATEFLRSVAERAEREMFKDRDEVDDGIRALKASDHAEPATRR